jgi:hypothetical protein
MLGRLEDDLDLLFEEPLPMTDEDMGGFEMVLSRIVEESERVVGPIVEESEREVGPIVEESERVVGEAWGDDFGDDDDAGGDDIGYDSDDGHIQSDPPPSSCSGCNTIQSPPRPRRRIQPPRIPTRPGSGTGHGAKILAWCIRRDNSSEEDQEMTSDDDDNDDNDDDGDYNP